MSEALKLVQEFAERHKLSWRETCKRLGVCRNWSSKPPTHPRIMPGLLRKIREAEKTIQRDGLDALSTTGIMTCSHLGPLCRKYKSLISSAPIATQPALVSMQLLCATKIVWRLRLHLGTWLLSAEIRSGCRAQDGVEIHMVTADSKMWHYVVQIWSYPKYDTMLYRLFRATATEELDTLLEGEISEGACNKLLALFAQARTNELKRQVRTEKAANAAIRASLKRNKKNGKNPTKVHGTSPTGQ